MLRSDAVSGNERMSAAREKLMQKITPFLWFDNEAEEAAKFYVSIFRNSKIVVKITRHGDAGPRPKGTVMTVDFRDAQAAEHIEQNISVYLRAF